MLTHKKVKHYGYVLRGEVSGVVKIGITDELEKRHRQHRARSAENIKTILTFDFHYREDAQDWEGRVLKDLEQFRLGATEWMLPCPAVQSIIDSGVAGGVMSTELLRFNRDLYLSLFTKTGGRPYVYKDTTKGWSAIVFHPDSPLASVHWEFSSWREVMAALPTIENDWDYFDEPYNWSLMSMKEKEDYLDAMAPRKEPKKPALAACAACGK